MQNSDTIDETVMSQANDRRRQIERILQSATFRNATTLQQLLQFLSQRALEGSAEQLKEYTIGLEALGRSQDFDPKTDTIVRVQIHRLRQKLREYYDTDGRHDPVLVEIPKGHYLPTFEPLESNPGLERENKNFATESTDDSSATAVTNKLINIRTLTFSALALSLLVLLFFSGFWLGSNGWPVGAKKSENRLLAPNVSGDLVRAFWKGLLGDDSTPVIAYPDAVFLLDNTNDLLRFRHGASDDRGALVDPHLARQFASNPKLASQAGDLYYENGYTGTGELQAVAALCGLFGRMGIRPILKPSHDITPVDLRAHTVILLGSPIQNSAVAQLVTPGDFTFYNPDAHLEQWRAQISNMNPRGGEQSSYRTERDPLTHVLKADYGVISIQGGGSAGRHLVILGGLDTSGTEGAMMFATTNDGVKALQTSLDLPSTQSKANEVPEFQALVKVALARGNEVLGTSLVTVHKISLHGDRDSESKRPLVSSR